MNVAGSTLTRGGSQKVVFFPLTPHSRGLPLSVQHTCARACVLRCILLSTKSEQLQSSITVITLELEVDLHNFNDVRCVCACARVSVRACTARRLLKHVCVCMRSHSLPDLLYPLFSLFRRRRGVGSGLPFTPFSPSFVAVQMQSDTLTSDDIRGAITYDDLVPPSFLQCPPSLAARTFPVAKGEAEALVSFPALTAFDAIDRTPTVTYPFATKWLSAVGWSHMARRKEGGGRREGGLWWKAAVAASNSGWE